MVYSVTREINGCWKDTKTDMNPVELKAYLADVMPWITNKLGEPNIESVSVHIRFNEDI